VARDDQDRRTLRPVGRFAGEAGVAIETIVRVADVARATPVLNDAASVLALVQLTAELDETFLPVNSRGWRREFASWYAELGRHGVSPAVIAALRSTGDHLIATRRAKRALGCLLWASGTPRQAMETMLMRHHRDNAIAGAVQTAVNRTIDLLPTTLRVLEFVHDTELDQLEADVLLRLQLGIPADLTDLGTLLSDRLSRTQYLALRDAGLTDPAALGAADDDQLAAILGVAPEAVSNLVRPSGAA
jgi:helicase